MKFSAVLKDDDAAKMKPILEWARSEGREKDITPELLETGAGSPMPRLNKSLPQ